MAYTVAGGPPGGRRGQIRLSPGPLAVGRQGGGKRAEQQVERRGYCPRGDARRVPGGRAWRSESVRAWGAEPRQRRELPAPGGTCCSPGTGEAGTGRPGRRGRGHRRPGGGGGGRPGRPAPGRKEAARLPWPHRRDTAPSPWPGPRRGTRHSRTGSPLAPTRPAVSAAPCPTQDLDKKAAATCSVSLGDCSPAFPSSPNGGRPVSPRASVRPQLWLNFHLEFSHLRAPELNFPTLTSVPLGHLSCARCRGPSMKGTPWPCESSGSGCGGIDKGIICRVAGQNSPGLWSKG